MTEPKPVAVPVLTTRVGHASHGYYSFRGYNVSADLVSKEGFWSAISLALGSRRRTPEEDRLLNDLAIALIGPDPRIWPWKLCRLMSAYGRFNVGLAGPIIAMSAGRVGPPALPVVARFLVELSDELHARTDGDSLAETIKRRLASDPNPPGFGTPYRREDERLVLITRIVERHGRAGGHYWQLVHRIAPLVFARKKLPLNAAGGVAAVCLDLGFSTSQIEAFGVLLLLVNLVANAYEGAEQAPEVLRKLPDHCVRYVGPPPRLSPRASGASED
jgi:hypothetical protein